MDNRTRGYLRLSEDIRRKAKGGGGQLAAMAARDQFVAANERALHVRELEALIAQVGSAPSGRVAERQRSLRGLSWSRTLRG